MIPIKGLPRAAKKNEWVALDIELYQAQKERLHRPTGSFAALSMAFDDEVYQITDLADIPKALKRLENGKWLFMNSGFDIRHLRRWADVPERWVWDIMLVEQDLFGGWYDSFALDDLVRRWLEKKMDKKPRDLFSNRTSMNKVMETYAATDAVLTLEVAKRQRDHMADIEEDLPCYFDIDQWAMWAILDMPGVRVDVDRWLEIGRKMKANADAIKVGLGFNPGASDACRQVVEGISKSLGIRVSRTPSGKVETGAETLEGLLAVAQVKSKTKEAKALSSILEYRTYSKAASTYGETWVEKHVEDGLVYPSWHVVGAETGRMSCSSPNLQQIPTRKMPEYRECFIASPGNRIISADSAQQEPRITAWFSQDKRLIDAVTTGDVYKPIAEQLGTTRDRAKVVFLGAMYGLTPQGMAGREKISVDEAEAFFHKFFSKYSGVRAWMDKSRRRAMAMNYVTTPTGRRVWINPYNQQWQNNALNGPIQGGAADLTKLALSHIHRKAAEKGLPFCVTMVVHDENVLDVPTKLVAQYKKIVEEAWREAGECITPGVATKVDIHTGTSWGAKHD